MRPSFSIQVGASLACVLSLLVNGSGVQGQAPKPKSYKIEFKVFAAKDPTGSPLTPFETATIHYRNKVESQPDFKFDLAITGPDKKGFYSVIVEEGWLIDNLVIRVKGAVNPAVVSKLVTRDNMVVYPGASDSGDTFKFPAYMTQMGTYRSLFREFVEDAVPNQREKNRVSLLDAFKQQLESMAKVNERLPDATDTEIASATKLKDEVIRLYFGLPERQECPPPLIFYYECPPPQMCCYPAQRCGLFGRRRCR